MVVIHLPRFTKLVSVRPKTVTIQMKSPNEVHIDFSNNPDAAAHFAGKKPGDICVFETRVQVKSIDANGMVGVIEKISSEYEEDKPAEPEPDRPMAMTIR